jgi:demethylmenaquinone methyltransferase/2-methoxy-6-polyprenyl-1,4-benzoquinol methylase
MVRVLEKEGRLLIEEPDIRYFAVKLIALMEKLLLMRSKFHTPDEIRLMAEGHGASARVGGDGKGSAWIMVDKEE